MKKRFMIPAFFLLFGYGVFAEINFSGLLVSGATLLEGTSNKGDDLRANGLLWGRLDAATENESGTIGGFLRIQTGLNLNANPDSMAWDEQRYWQWKMANSFTDPYAWVWWKPIEQVRVQVGFIQDFFAVSEIVGWDFNGNDAEDNDVALAGYSYSGDIFDRSTGFYDGTWWTGAAVSVTPIDGLTMIVAIPYEKGNDDKTTAADVYQYTNAQVTYNIDGIGRFALSFKGGGNGKYALKDNGVDIDANASTLYGSFLLGRYENMGINVGVAYTLPVERKDPVSNTTITCNLPVAAGLGFLYDYGKFGFRARMAATFGGSTRELNGILLRDPLKLGFGINPSYDFGAFKLLFNTGISFSAENATDSAAFGWHINPYVTKRIGPCTFYAGFQVESDGMNHDIIRWGIPIACQLEF